MWLLYYHILFYFIVLGLIYIVGGMSELGVELRTVESYNPITKEWRQLARMATPRAYVGVAVLDDYIYAVGGWNETRRALRTVERYSIEEVSVLKRTYNQWKI